MAGTQQSRSRAGRYLSQPKASPLLRPQGLLLGSAIAEMPAAELLSPSPTAGAPSDFGENVEERAVGRQKAVALFQE